MSQSIQIRNSQQVNLELTPIHWNAIFDRYDTDNDGKISFAEFKQLFKEGSAQGRGDIPKRAQREILRRADLNRDGFLNREEFIKLIQSDGFIHSLIERRLDLYVKAVVPTRRVDLPDYAGEYEELYTCRPPALCMLIISLLEIISFLYDWGVAGETKASGPLASQIIYDPYRRREAWRFLTYMFVHVGSVHLTVNLLVQILLGVPLEMVHKGWRVCLVYIAGVVAGSLGTSISDPRVFLAGASGGVYALMSAHVATLIMNWQEMQFAVLQLIVFLVIALVDIGTAIYNRYVVGAQDPIGYVAHLAGALAGLFVGIFVLRNISKRSWENKVWWAALAIYFALLMAAIFWNIFWSDYFPAERWN